jgi:hypothetical protein
MADGKTDVRQLGQLESLGVKKTYEKPTLVKRGTLSAITASRSDSNSF